MDASVGILRTGAGLEAAEDALRDAGQVDLEQLDDGTLVALLVTRCALHRRESRGGHTRLDHTTTAVVPDHTNVTLVDLLSQSGHRRDRLLTGLDDAEGRVRTTPQPDPAPAPHAPTDPQPSALKPTHPLAH
ncbi:hypothetical protein, partial [Intrasporangium chromatireducens]|uniref:hypothetical protein n=1 Tax=Intrasporangium chromatireducens TaxID=1386088 RepID=UPI001969B8F5